MTLFGPISHNYIILAIINVLLNPDDYSFYTYYSLLYPTFSTGQPLDKT